MHSQQQTKSEMSYSPQDVEKLKATLQREHLEERKKLEEQLASEYEVQLANALQRASE